MEPEEIWEVYTIDNQPYVWTNGGEWQKLDKQWIASRIYAAFFFGVGLTFFVIILVSIMAMIFYE